MFRRLLSRMASPAYQSYLKQSQVLQKPGLRNLNQMNPYLISKSLVFKESRKGIFQATPQMVFDKWKNSMRFDDFDHYPHYVSSIGVRSSLLHLFQSMTNRFWIPSDVYPIYGKLIDEAKTESNPFQTQNLELKRLLASLDQENDLLLLTDPNVIQNSQLSVHQIRSLISWLKESPKRLLVIDAVYAPQYNPFYGKLLATNQVVICYSLSKSYLLPLTFGITLCSENMVPILERNPYQPDQDQINEAFHRLSVYPEMPRELEAYYRKRWVELNSELLTVDDTWIPPRFGYYGNLSGNWKNYYDQHNMLTIPANLFGESNQETLVTCLPDDGTNVKLTSSLFHVMPLSNFHQGFDKYSLTYKKGSKNKFHDRFHLLPENELEIGFRKTNQTLEKIGIPNDQALIIKTQINQNEVKANIDPGETGLGYYIKQNFIKVTEMFLISNGVKIPISVEDAYAKSLALVDDQLRSWEELEPRTVSILPVAIGCQAKCPFCFSHSSVSSEAKQKRLAPERVEYILEEAKKQGATRAVITGGGEPGMLPFDRLINMIRQCSNYFQKTVMITNGYFIGTLDEKDCVDALASLDRAGLNVLSISRHEASSEDNEKIMWLKTCSENVARTWKQHQYERLKLRWVCVLQKNGVDSPKKIARYLDWVVSSGVSEICFKELYVATSLESVYYEESGNIWSREHQIPLKMLVDFLKSHGGVIVNTLPWGSPIYRLKWNDVDLDIAAYTEPSVYWERYHQIARSWNLLANGDCFVSLEDKKSLLNI